MNAPSLKQNRKSGLLHFTFIPILAVLIYVSAAGVNFGHYWDEGVAYLRPVERSIRGGSFLPDWYIYPSLRYELTLLCTVPDIFKYFSSEHPEKTGLRAYLLEKVKGRDFLLRSRLAGILVTHAALVWIYWAVFVWRRSRIEAFLAASLAGLSWEFAYHARWPIVDTFVMQFAALMILALILSQMKSAQGERWLRLSALAAGLACGSKYTGGLLLIPVLITCFIYGWKVAGKKIPFRILINKIWIFFFAYLITTPGTLFQFAQFTEHIIYDYRAYSGGHGGYTVTPGWDHFSRIFVYFFLVMFSKYPLIAAFFFILALIGVVTLVLEEKRMALIFLSFPCLYLVFFSLQKIMIVRNYLVIIPFFAILAARGTVFLYRRVLVRRSFRAMFAFLTILFLCVNGFWLY